MEMLHIKMVVMMQIKRKTRWLHLFNFDKLMSHSNDLFLSVYFSLYYKVISKSKHTDT